MKLTGKTILVLSPQSWGMMFISKHHFAVELAKRGNTVYFLDPPEDKKTATAAFSIKELEHAEGLYLVKQQLRFPARLRFHFPAIFSWLMKRHLRRLIKFLPKRPDIIWSFDLNKVYDLASFPDDMYKIFHPVDEPLSSNAIDSANGAQIIFSVTEEIISKYAHLSIPRHNLNHGVAQRFLEEGEKIRGVKRPGPIRVGISGNMLRADLDRATLLKIVTDNPELIFECWGASKINSSNIGGGADKETMNFLKALENAENVQLHGPVSPEALARELPRMDLFLICYDVEKDQSKGTNYHKILEYLATGKVIVSNNVTTYKDRPDLVVMVPERDSNSGLPSLFKSVVQDLSVHNSEEAISRRKDFARANTYRSKVEQIEGLLV